MKYKIISKRTITRSQTALVPFTAPTSPTPISRKTEEKERILFDTLFEFSALEEAPREQKPQKRPRRVQKKSLREMLVRLGENIERKQKRPTSFYTRLLTSVLGIELSVALIAALVFFGRAIIPHSTLIIPSFIGDNVEYLESAKEYELIISYENHSELSAGTVISQTPPPDNERKLYFGKEKCKIFLTVSAGKRSYDIPDLTGRSRRDALLLLKNSDIPVKIVTQYSDTAKAGYVIETVPSPDQKLYEGDVLTLKISLGAPVRTAYVPSLFGLNESEASAAISAAGLKLGRITYQSSDIPAGKVISQQYTPFSKVRSGQSIDITVSLGNAFTQKYVPDLYGLTVEQAAEKLKEVGLVIGNIYAISSGSPSGTVISQSPLPSTPITSNITSVDIYVSS